MTAGVYYLGSFFASNSGEYFQHVFSVVYVGSLILAQVLGIYLLLCRLTKDQRVLIPASVLFGLLFCNPALVMGWFFQTFYPFLMYAFLSFFVTLRLRYLFLSLLMTVILLNQSLVYTCYTFLTIHLFLVVCLLWAVAMHGKALLMRGKIVAASIKQYIPHLAAFAVLSIILLAPYVYIQLFEINTLEFGKATSRMAHLWDIRYYFQNTEMFVLDYKQFFMHMLDLTGNVGYVSSYFFGYIFFFLAALAVCCSRDTKKWIFVGTLLLVWFLNFPRDHVNIGWIAHVLTAMTNPLAIIVRDYNLASLCIVPFLLFPLVILGVNVVIEAVEKKTGNAGRFIAAAALAMVFASLTLPGQPAQTKVYLYVFMTVSFLAGLVICFSAQRSRRIAGAIVLGAMLLTDAAFSWHQVKTQLLTYQIRPREVMVADKLLWMDYQNPKIFPFVDHFESSNIYDGDHNPFLWTLRDANLSFFHVLNPEIFFIRPDGHNPRHVSYGQWWKDGLMKAYLAQNPQVFFFARLGVQSQPGIVENIVSRGLARDVVAIEGAAPGILPFIPEAVHPQPPLPEKWTVTAMTGLMDFWDRFDYDGRMMVWNFKVHGSLPKHIATNVLVKDPSVRFAIQMPEGKTVEFEPVQGGFVKPLTFDMQNMKEGEVRAALPIDTSFSGAKGVLLIKTNPAFSVLNVVKHTNDTTVFRYNAPDNGWLGMHLPYDRRFRVSVDNKPVKIWRMNKSFMAVPITPGTHQVSLQYAPDSWLRLGLVAALLAALIAYAGFIFLAFRFEDKHS